MEFMLEAQSSSGFIIHGETRAARKSRSTPQGLDRLDLVSRFSTSSTLRHFQCPLSGEKRRY